MKILTIANQKGGVGKSTLAIHLAHFALSVGLRTVVIDLDPQGNCSESLTKALKADYVDSYSLFERPLNCVDTNFMVFSGNSRLSDISELSENFTQNIKMLSGQFDLCIIDTPPTASYLQISPLVVSDFVISPIELQNWSYEGSIPFITMLENLRSSNKLQRPKFLGLLPSRVWIQSQVQRNDLASLKNSSFASNLFGHGDFYIPNRHAYTLAGNTGMPIWSFRNSSSARAEGKNMKKICNAILDKMSLLSNV